MTGALYRLVLVLQFSALNELRTVLPSVELCYAVDESSYNWAFVQVTLNWLWDKKQSDFWSDPETRLALLFLRAAKIGSQPLA